MFDALLHAMAQARAGSSILAAHGLSAGGFTLTTIHRAENTDDPARLGAVIDMLRQEAERSTVVWPMHPRARQAVAKAGIDLGGICAIDPVGYIDMAGLLDGCALVMTDSGGLQKEAYFARRPCITLRDETEWVETVTHGWNRLWTSPDWATPRADIPDYGSGRAAEYILDIIRAAA